MARKKYKIEKVYWDIIHGERVLVKRYTPGPSKIESHYFTSGLEEYSQGDLERLLDLYEAFQDEEFLRKELEEDEEEY